MLVLQARVQLDVLLCYHPHFASPCGWLRMPLAWVNRPDIGFWGLVPSPCHCLSCLQGQSLWGKHCRNLCSQTLALQHHWKVLWDWWQQTLYIPYSSLPTSQVGECVWVQRQQQSDASLHPCRRAHPKPASESRYSMSSDALNGLAHKHQALLKIQDECSPKTP